MSSVIDRITERALRVPAGRMCRAWRPNSPREDHAFSHDPGDCRICWRPCHQVRRGGTAFCDDCWHLLAAHRAVKVRFALLSRDDIPVEYLEYMTNDLDAQIAGFAEDRLASFAEDEEIALGDDDDIPASIGRR